MPSLTAFPSCPESLSLQGRLSQGLHEFSFKACHRTAQRLQRGFSAVRKLLHSLPEQLPPLLATSLLPACPVVRTPSTARQRFECHEAGREREVWQEAHQPDAKAKPPQAPSLRSVAFSAACLPAFLFLPSKDRPSCLSVRSCLLRQVFSCLMFHQEDLGQLSPASFMPAGRGQ